GQHLRVAPGRVGASGPCRDRSQGDLPLHLHRAVEEDGQVILSESEDAPLGLGELPDEAEVDGVELVALADGPGIQVLGKGLAGLRMFGQPVAGPRTRQGISQRAQLLFQFRVRPCHGWFPSPGRIREREPDEAACMCGRFTLRSSPQAVAEAFALPDVPELFPRFNIAPGQAVAVVRQEPRAEGRELALLRWGLIPAWAADPSIGERLANARSETAATKPSFRRAFRSRRCLVVADGFYEWQR